MRLAIIDLGTNTFNLLIAEKLDNEINYLFEDKLPVKLAKGGIYKNLINIVAQERGLKAIKKHLISIDKYRINSDKIYVFATAAFRAAENGKAFAEKIFQETNLRVNIISGDREAEFIYTGVLQTGLLKEQYDLIMDIGGGSTEFIIANKDSIKWKKSYELGASRLLEQFKPDDPITAKQITELRLFLKSQLKELFNQLSLLNCENLIGVSGAFDTVRDVLVSHKIINNRNEFSPDKYDWFYQKIIHLNHNERVSLAGMTKFRADMVVLGAILIDCVLQNIACKKIKVSEASLKEGAIYQLVS